LGTGGQDARGEGRPDAGSRGTLLQKARPARIFTVDILPKPEPNSSHRFQAVFTQAVVRERQACSGAKMNKADLIDKIAASTGISKSNAAMAIEA